MGMLVRKLYISHPIMLIGLILAGLVALPSAASASTDPIVILCNDCSTTAQFNHAATRAAPFDGSFNSVDDVYVVNIESREIRALRVSITMVDPDPFFLGDEIMTTTVESINGEPELMTGLLTDIEGIWEFHYSIIQDIDASELDIPFDSALDLIGGGSASFNRRALQNRLEQRFDGLFSQFAVYFNNFFRMAGNVFGATSSFPGPGIGRFTVTFPDGSLLKADVNTTPDPTQSGFDLEFDVTVDMESMTAEDAATIPLSAAELGSFDFSTRNPELSQEFQDLLRRLGAEVRAPGGSSGSEFCTTTISCSPNTGSPDEPEWRCQVSIEDC